MIPKECQKSSSIKRWEKIGSAVSLIYMLITINIFDRNIYISEPHSDTFQFKMAVSVKQCQECQEQEKRNQEANEELAKKDQIIQMLKEEVDKKEKVLTAMKGGKKKEMTEMKTERKEKEMTMKEELGKKEKELTAIKEEMKKKEKEMTAMNKEMEEKEKEITAMKEEMEKKDVEMTTVKKKLQLTENMLELAHFLESKNECIMNQKEKDIEKNNFLIEELKDEIQHLSDQTLCSILL